MKNKFALLAWLFAALIFFACSDDGPYVCNDCVSSPEALPANDANGKGIYKGVVVGSSGTIKIDIDNEGDGLITAVLVIDGDEINLTTTSEYGEAGFQGCLVNEAEDVSICINVFNNGTISLTEIEIPNHPNVEIQIMKEFSSQQVLAFEGSYKGDANGALNMIIRLEETGNGLWYAIWKENDEDEAQFPNGEIIGGAIFGGGGEVNISGTPSGDTIKGTWESLSAESSGTWKGKRTL